MPCHQHLLGHFFLLQLLLLVLLPHNLEASPVSSPEISAKGSKSPNSVQQQVHQQQHQQQQQQQQAQQQEAAHLNSLSAYASGYDMSQNPGLNPGQNSLGDQATADVFKPSYKMPEMETNFTPMQTAGTPSVASLPSTPMLMQYLPAQTLQDGGAGGGVQYLQLIPTRPIIVPISPYLSNTAGAGMPQISATGQPDYSAGRTATVLSALPPNYGALQGYAAAGALSPAFGQVAPSFRTGYRINRETKDKHFPPTFSLNINEYIPASSVSHHGSDQAGSHLYMRARTA